MNVINGIYQTYLTLKKTNIKFRKIDFIKHYNLNVKKKTHTLQCIVTCLVECAFQFWDLLKRQLFSFFLSKMWQNSNKNFFTGLMSCISRNRNQAETTEYSLSTV